MNHTTTLLLFSCAVLAPLAATVFLALHSWLSRTTSESTIALVSLWSFAVSFLSCLVLGILLGLSGEKTLEFELGSWFGSAEFSRRLEFVCDRLSVPFGCFVTGLLFVVSSFSRKYLHRESGYLRYYLLLCLFGGGTLILVFAGSLDFLFFGWETVGLTSTLLIAFFHERRAPVSHALRAFVTYRVCDIGLLGGAIWLHHTVGGTHAVTHTSLPWWGLEVPARASDALIVGLFLVFASMGKSAQVPFSGWLPRAMEGPTPSSAIFYGAISVHLGAYLLLRAGDILVGSPLVAALVVLVGAGTALQGTLVGRVQTDIKSALAYASLVQVGVIFVEIGLGFRYLALLHIVSHAALRCFQILRSPSILHDHLRFEVALGEPLPRLGVHFERLLSPSKQRWLYHFALERGVGDNLIRDYIVEPVLRASKATDLLQERILDLFFSDAPQETKAELLTIEESR